MPLFTEGRYDFWQPYDAAGMILTNPPDGIYVAGDVHRQPFMMLKEDLDDSWMENEEGYISWTGGGTDSAIQTFDGGVTNAYDLDHSDVINWHSRSPAYKRLVLNDIPELQEQLDAYWHNRHPNGSIVNAIYSPMVIDQLRQTRLATDYLGRRVSVPTPDEADNLTDDEIYSRYLQRRREVASQRRENNLSQSRYAGRRAHVNLDGPSTDL
jgi:hypothetical protein